MLYLFKSATSSYFFPAANRDFQLPSQFSVDSSKSDKVNTEICQQADTDSDVKRMIKMLEQQASSAQEGNHGLFVYNFNSTSVGGKECFPAKKK